MKRCLLTLGLALMITAGCETTKAPPPAPTPAPAPAPTPVISVPGAEPKTVLADDQLPTEEDFENEAEQSITTANRAAALDQLEKEIGAP